MNSQQSHLQQAVKSVFTQIEVVLHDLHPAQYSMPSSTLFNATIGQHVRHIIELFVELEKGYGSGTVNYEKRKRDYRIETDKDLAIDLLTGISNTIERQDRLLVLEAGFNGDTDELITIDSNYFRELAYNLEHTIHHMALIRVGINELSSVTIDERFGIASSTIKHRNSCVL